MDITNNITYIAQYGVAVLSIYLFYRIVAVHIKRQNQLIEENTKALNNLSRLIERNIIIIEQAIRYINRCDKHDTASD